MAKLIINARILTEHRTLARGWLYLAEGLIQSFAAGDPPTFEGATVLDAQGALLAPGFIDVHVHGALGVEAMDADPASLQTMSRFYARHGVTSYLPTTLTAPHERILAALTTIQQAQSQTGGATILGAHLEGPYLNAAKAGAQFPEFIRRADPTEALQYLDTGVIRLLAVAPEFTENHWLIRACVQRGIAVAVAHTAATYEEAQQGFALGITQATHTYNAMTPLHHRNPGVVGAVLATPDIYAEIICDLFHVHPGAIQALYQAKGCGHTLLITDAMAAAGQPDGEYMLGAHTVVKRAGRVTLKADDTLAGSAATFDMCVRNFMQAVNQPFEAIWPVTSLTPARAIHQSHQRGSIAPGKIADLVLLDDRVQVKVTLVSGEVVYQAE